ncbi:MAG: PCYCGC motif-containing (lipo)protein [Vicinamibacterales bacterium]
MNKWLSFAVAFLLATGAGVVLAQTTRAGRPAATQVSRPPLPNPGFAPARPLDVTRRAYEFAADHPEVIQYVPCFCGCERSGHGSNESCFVKSRDAQGHVTAWDSHGWGCTICVDVAIEASQMYALGAKPAGIRAAIDRKWRQRFPTSTPTPVPPPGHNH